MREILFKGKRKDHGEWVEGDILKSDERYFIVPSMGVSCIEDYEHAETNKFIQLYAYEIDPKTVCQFTGLTDKNGKKIFEGDILQGHGNKNELCKVVLGGFYIIDAETLEKVEYVNGWHTEVILTDALSKTEPFCLDMPLTDFYIERSEFEVIGNIFDNPDLLRT